MDRKKNNRLKDDVNMARILAIDDDDAILRLIRKMLEMKNHEVTTLLNIKEITIMKAKTRLKIMRKVVHKVNEVQY